MKNSIKKKKRIGIDARFYGPKVKGLGRYTKEIVDNIIKIDNYNDYVIFLSKDNFSEFKILKEDKNRIKKVLTDVKWYTFSEQIFMPFFIYREKLDLIHFPHFNVPIFTPIKFVITIHDLILTKFPTIRATKLSPMLYKIKNIAYKIVIKTAVKKAKKIITVSNFTKEDIIKKFKIAEKRIKVTYEGVTNFLEKTDYLSDEKNDKKTFLKYNINSPFLLYVGNAYPHKNLENLVEVFLKIQKENKNLSLVLVGKEDYFYKRLKKTVTDLNFHNNKNLNFPIIFTGYVPDEELDLLYKKALVYVFPSFYEGFGLPPLEAMARGCPVASSDKSCMKEILGEAAFYFNPEDKSDMKEKIERIVKDDILRNNLIIKGYKQVKKFSWKECAEKTIEVYNNI